MRSNDIDLCVCLCVCVSSFFLFFFFFFAYFNRTNTMTVITMMTKKHQRATRNNFVSLLEFESTAPIYLWFFEMRYSYDWSLFDLVRLYIEFFVCRLIICPKTRITERFCTWNFGICLWLFKLCIWNRKKGKLVVVVVDFFSCLEVFESTPSLDKFNRLHFQLTEFIANGSFSRLIAFNRISAQTTNNTNDAHGMSVCVMIICRFLCFFFYLKKFHLQHEMITAHKIQR